MNILQINTAAKIGGAARLMYDLHLGFYQRGHASRIIARIVRDVDPRLSRLRDLVADYTTPIDHALNSFGRRLDAWFGIPSFYLLSNRILSTPVFTQADILQLHNLHGGYFNWSVLPQFAGRKPTFWTLHDTWPLTGHCAYPYDCQRWETGCFACPLLSKDHRGIVVPGPTKIDRTKSVWRQKQKIYSQAKMTIIAPSTWLYEMAQKSPLLSIQTIVQIPNGVDILRYTPGSAIPARARFGLPLEKKIILFVAAGVDIYRKGFAHLKEAIEYMQPDEKKKVYLLIVGSTSRNQRAKIALEHQYLGYINDNKWLIDIYRLADVLIFPSLADNLPRTIQEALSCGTPVVAFKVGGIPDLVIHQKTGYLANYQDSFDLYRGIITILNHPGLTQMKANCRKHIVQGFSLEAQVTAYLELYSQALVEQQHNSPT